MNSISALLLCQMTIARAIGGLNISFSKVELQLFEGHREDVALVIHSDRRYVDCDEVIIISTIRDTTIARLHTNLMNLDFQQQNESCTANVTVEGIFLGRTTLSSSATNIRNQSFGSRQLSIVVVRSKTESKLASVFTVIATMVLLITATAMGTQLEWSLLVIQVKQPVGIVIGLACQCCLMPLIAFSWGKLMFSEKTYFWFSYFAIGCSPGGGMSNMWTILMDGNLDLSAAMTFFSSVLALANLPLWLMTLGKLVILKSENNVGVPFENVFLALAFVMVPCIVGMLIKHYFPKVAVMITKLIKKAMLVFILIMVVFGTYVNSFVFQLITWKTVIAGLLLPWTGFAFGVAVPKLLGRSWCDARTIGIETGIQNMQLALVILRMSFEEPESDLAMVIPFCCLMLTPIPLAILTLAYTIHKKIKERKTNTIKPSLLESPKKAIEGQETGWI